MSAPEVPAFYSDRLVFRAAHSSNADDFIDEVQSDIYTQMCLSPSAIKPWRSGRAQEWVKYHDPHMVSWMICLPKEGADRTNPRIGYDQLTRIGWINLNEHGAGSVHRKANVALAMHSDYQGKGYGTEAIRHVIRYAFLNCGLRKLEIEAFAWNEPAIKAYKKAGFHIEGTKKESFFFSGRFWDEVFLALFKRDWLKTQGLEGSVQLE